MNMLAVAPQNFFAPHGTPLSVYYRTLVLAEQGVSIDLLTYGAGQDVEIPGVRIIRIPRLKSLEPIPVGPSWTKLIHDFLMITWTIGLLIRHRYQVVHAHEEAVFWCRLLKPIFRFKLIYDMHSSLPQQLVNFRFTESRIWIGLFRMLEKNCLKAADAVITICQDLRDYALESGTNPNRHMLIENSIFEDVRLVAVGNGDPPSVQELVDFGPAHPVILYAGTFEVYQGIEMLVEAFSLVRARCPDARLLLVGGTQEQVRGIRALADSLELGSTCVLTGRVPKSLAMRYTHAAQVLVSPRLHGTNTPLKIYEHLASGRPVVATAIWSHTQVLDESVSYLVEPTPEALAAGIVTALTDEAGSARRVENALALYERAYARPIYEQKIQRLVEVVT